MERMLILLLILHALLSGAFVRSITQSYASESEAKPIPKVSSADYLSSGSEDKIFGKNLFYVRLFQEYIIVIRFITFWDIDEIRSIKWVKVFSALLALVKRSYCSSMSITKLKLLVRRIQNATSESPGRPAKRERKSSTSILEFLIESRDCNVSSRSSKRGQQR